jgi:hypothetical protein
MRLAVAIFGLLLLVAAVFPYIRSRAVARSRDWHTVIVPLSLRSGSSQNIDLGSDLGGKYEINIEFEEAPIAGKLDCPAGKATFGQYDCVAAHEIFETAWSLYENRTLVREGSSSDSPSVLYSPPIIIRRIGQFTAVKDHDYSLVVSLKREAPEMEASHPKVTVRVPMDVLEGYYAGAFIEKLEAAVLCFVGAIIVLSALYLRKPSKNGNDR